MTDAVVQTAERPAAAVAAPTRLAYSPALDGLRAIAVGAVLVYHGFSHGASRPWGRGGFLGVDIFFVLSGYLITALLLAEFDKTAPSLRSFWARRIRRLFPALLVAFAVAAIYAATTPHARLVETRADAIFTLLYVQNWHVIATNGKTVFSPLSHTWSLSVEEQWYAIWPIALFAALAWRRMRRRTVAYLLVGAACASLVTTALLYTPNDTARAFFGTDTRGVGLLVGAIFALLWSGTGTFTQPRVRYSVEIAAWCGAVFLAFELVYARENDTFLYHGGFLLVALATGLVITAALRSDGYMRRALSLRPLVALGLISYGVYMYHRLINEIVSPQRFGLRDLGLFPIRALVTIVFAYASYRLLERPIRDRRLKIPYPAIVVPVLTAVVFSLVLVTTKDAPKGASAALTPGAVLWLDRQRVTTPPKATRVLVVGETNAFLLQQHFNDTFDGAGIRGLSYGLFGCSLAAGDIVLGDGSLDHASGCDQWPATFRKVADTYQPDVVVLIAGDQAVFDREIHGSVQRAGTREWRASIHTQLDAARAALTAGDARFLLTTTPCTVRHDRSQLETAHASDERIAMVNDAFREYAASRSVPLADLGLLLCPDGHPLRERNGQQLADSKGFTDDGARYVWQWIAAQVRATGSRSGSS